MKFWLVASFAGLASALAAAQSSVPLLALSPVRAWAKNPNIDVRPQTGSFLPLNGSNSDLAIRFVANSEVSYQIPEGENSFSALLAYAEANRDQPPASSSNRLLVRILLDGKPAFETGMEETTPPEEFSLPLDGARVLTIVSAEDYNWDVFALANAQFSSARCAAASTFLLSGKGYVDFAPLTRQALFHVFRPGESVRLTAYAPVSASAAQVRIQITPEQSRKPLPVVTVSVAVHKNRSTGSRGEATWAVPLVRGPAMLRIDEQVNGTSIFQREERIAIAPAVNLAAVADSGFGVHTSSPGFLELQDEFAGLWGAKWDRALVRWEVVEPTPGHYDFSRSDAIVDSLEAQHMRVLGVLGESWPRWAGTPGASYYSAWARFVAAAVRHYREKIDHWDIFNEIDVKYDQLREAYPDFDLQILRLGLETVRNENARAKTICCSPGMTPWLPYYKRLFNAGLLPLIDIVSLHPYELTAPEEKDGALDYSDRLHALRKLIHETGDTRPLWATEANWILGKRGTPYVTAPDLDEHTQAEYIVRVNLISWAQSVPYFLHSPFYHSTRTELQLDSLDAYSEMASLFSTATHPRFLVNGPGVYGITGETGNATVGAMWTVSSSARVGLTGVSGVRFLDLYGNPISEIASSLKVTPAVIYFITGAGSAPKLNILQPVSAPLWKTLPLVSNWIRTQGSAFTKSSGRLGVTTQPSKYTYQLRSPSIDVEAGTCYIARISLNLEQGSTMLFAVNPATEKRVGDSVYMAFLPDGTLHESYLRFQTGTTRSIQLIIANANLAPAVSRFEVADHAEVSKCQ